MLSGRHLLLVGLLAAAGLLSIRDSQEQIVLGYSIARAQDSLRKLEVERKTELSRLEGLQAPERVITKAVQLHLEVAPVSPLEAYATPELEQKQRQMAQRLERPAASRPAGNAPRAGGPGRSPQR